MSKPDPQWQRSTALRHIERYRNELVYQERQFTDRHLAEFGAKYVGADVADVQRWMTEDAALKAQQEQQA